MHIDFATGELDRLEHDPTFNGGLPREVVSAYRKRLQGIRSALDTRDLAALACWHVEVLDGARAGCLAIALAKGARLIVDLPHASAGQQVRVDSIEVAA
jgi:proteic killer suppression protein